MYAPAASALLPARILYLARREPSARTDASVLRSLGVRAVTTAARGADALALLQNSRFSGALICGGQPEDMSLAAFLQALAASWRNTPVLVLTASETAAQALRKAGVQTLTRPYAAEDLARALNKTLSPLRRPLEKAALDALALSSPPAGESPCQTAARAERGPSSPDAGGSPCRKSGIRPLLLSDLLARAWNALRRKEFGQAEAAFREVLRRQEDHPEACLGLARLYREQGNGPSTRRFLLRAAAASLRRGEKEQARAIAALLPERMRGLSLYMHEALARLEEGDARAAARSFLEICRTRPSARLHSVLARACQLSAKPEDNLIRLCSAFESLGRTETARMLRQRLLRQDQPDGPEEDPSWLDNFPRLKEIAGVASATVRAWRLAG
jgi:CheY-like chemotaxis protein